MDDISNYSQDVMMQPEVSRTSTTRLDAVEGQYIDHIRSLAAEKTRRKSTVITVSCGEAVAAFPVSLVSGNGDHPLPGFVRLVAFLEEQSCSQKCRVSVAGDITDLGILREAWLLHNLPGDFWVQDTPIGPIAHFGHMVTASELAQGMRITGHLKDPLL